MTFEQKIGDISCNKLEMGGKSQVSFKTKSQKELFETTPKCFDKGNVSVKSKLQHPPPGHTPGIWRLFLPGREGIWST